MISARSQVEAQRIADDEVAKEERIREAYDHLARSLFVEATKVLISSSKKSNLYKDEINFLTNQTVWHDHLGYSARNFSIAIERGGIG